MNDQGKQGTVTTNINQKAGDNVIQIGQLSGNAQFVIKQFVKRPQLLYWLLFFALIGLYVIIWRMSSLVGIEIPYFSPVGETICGACTKPSDGVSSSISTAISLPPPDATVTFTPAPKLTCTANTGTNRLNLRAGPSEEDRIIAKLDNGTNLTPLPGDQIGNWIKVKVDNSNDIEGWVNTDFVNCNNFPPSAPPAEIEPTIPIPPTPEQFAPNSLVTGLVDSIDGPLEGISVWLGKGDWGCGNRDYTTITDATGRYTFGNIPPGQYCVSANYDRTGPGFYNASWAGEQSKSSSQDLNVGTLYLLRWDLKIIFPTAGQVLDTTTHTFQWEKYPLASQYLVTIHRTPYSDARENIMYDGTTHDTFLEVTLDKGTYELEVDARSGDRAFAFYSVDFSIEP